MSEYIIHNIGLTVVPQFDFDENEEKDKPVSLFPNFYLGKIIGKKGSELSINRTRRGEGEEHIPNCVLRNENGIALIRIHNKENLTIYDLPDSTEKEVQDCIGTSQYSYPYAYVIVDYRNERCQIAIEKSSAWDRNTKTIRNGLEIFFNDKLYSSMGIHTTIKEKTIRTQFEDFIDCRTIDYGDIIEEFTFKYVNTKHCPTTRIPKELTEEMEMRSKILETYGALSATTTMKLGTGTKTDKLKQLSAVVGYSSDNAFDLVVKFRNYGEYTCNENIIAKYPMNDIVISNYREYRTPEIETSDFDLTKWLDEVFYKVKERKDDKEIPTKPKR